jgi:hypothetical protein
LAGLFFVRQYLLPPPDFAQPEDEDQPV